MFPYKLQLIQGRRQKQCKHSKTLLWQSKDSNGTDRLHRHVWLERLDLVCANVLSGSGVVYANICGPEKQLHLTPTQYNTYGDLNFRSEERHANISKDAFPFSSRVIFLCKVCGIHSLTVSSLLTPFEVPSNLFLNKIGKPALYLPTVMIVWGKRGFPTFFVTLDITDTPMQELSLLPQPR